MLGCFTWVPFQRQVLDAQIVQTDADAVAVVNVQIDIFEVGHAVVVGANKSAILAHHRKFRPMW